MVESLSPGPRDDAEESRRIMRAEVRSVLLGMLLAAVAITIGAFAGLWIDPVPASAPAHVRR